jgi:hypothetical protein
MNQETDYEEEYKNHPEPDNDVDDGMALFVGLIVFGMFAICIAAAWCK